MPFQMVWTPNNVVLSGGVIKPFCSCRQLPHTWLRKRQFLHQWTLHKKTKIRVKQPVLRQSTYSNDKAGCSTCTLEGYKPLHALTLPLQPCPGAGSTRMQASRSSWDFPLLSKANLPPRFAESLVKASSPPKLVKNLAKASSPQKLAKSLVVLTSELPLWCLCLLLFGRKRHQARSIPVKLHCVSEFCWHVEIQRFFLGSPLEILPSLQIGGALWWERICCCQWHTGGN